MKFKITSRWDGTVLFSGKYRNLTLCVEVAFSSGANLFGTNLSEADLVTVGWIGSRKSYITYNETIDEVRCGSFVGTMAKFKAKVKDTYKPGSLPRIKYDVAIAFMLKVSKARAALAEGETLDIPPHQ